MVKKIRRVSFSLFILSFYLFFTNSAPIFLISASTAPSKLKVYVGPPKILADKGVYDCILVQLQDSRGLPARAMEDIVVSLSSSKTDIGSVDPSCSILAGNTHASAKFFSTYTPGSTTITAFASGYHSEQATITTVGPIPSKLAVYCLPQILPADKRAYDAVIVQLQDPAGTPARAPIGDTEVFLTSSNIDVGKVDSSLTIKSGSTYAIAKFYTTSTAGSTAITAVSSGYTSGQSNVITSEFGDDPYKLKVDVGPPKITAEGLAHESISIQIQDSRGRLVKAKGDLDVTLTSSKISIGNVEPLITIPLRKTHAVTKFYSTYRSGVTTITAAASGYVSGQASVNTVGPIPSKIAVYGFPPIVPADNDAYSIIVQLQDSAGKPAKDPIGDIKIQLSSSNTELGNVNSTTIIPFNRTYSTTKFESNYVDGSVTITAVAPDYSSGKAILRTCIIDPLLSVSVTAHPASIKSDEHTTIRIYVTHNAITPPTPVPGATITLTSERGGVFSSVTDERNGYYTAVFTAPTADKQMITTTRVSAIKYGYAGASGQVQLTINPPKVGGKIIIQVEDSKENSISHSAIASTSQPSGQPPLVGTTNNTGHIEFHNVTDGYYIIEVNKEGYITNNQLVNVTDGQTTSVIFKLMEEKSPGIFNHNIKWFLIAGVVASVFIVIIIVKRTR